MVSRLTILAWLCIGALGSAHAATVILPGVSGIPDKAHDQANPNGCKQDVPTGTMIADMSGNDPDPSCLMSFPVTLPQGATIDSIAVGYIVSPYLQLPSGSQRSITAYLGKSKAMSAQYPVAVAGANDYNISQFQIGAFALQLTPTGTPITPGYMYWVQVATHYVDAVQYILISYH